MAQIVAKLGAAHTFILIDQYDVIIAERVAGLNLNRAINELKGIAAEQGLVIEEKPAPAQAHFCAGDCPHSAPRPERGPSRTVILTNLAIGSDR